MTVETAAEMLYDEYPGTIGRFHTSTQKDRWLTFTAKVVAAAQPAPAGAVVVDREAIARAAWSSYDGEQSWDELCALAEQHPDADYAEIRDGYLGEGDRILTILPGRAEAQVKAEALREAARFLRDRPNGSMLRGPVTDGYMADLGYYGEADWLRDRADRIERGEPLNDPEHEHRWQETTAHTDAHPTFTCTTCAATTQEPR